MQVNLGKLTLVCLSISLGFAIGPRVIARADTGNTGIFVNPGDGWQGTGFRSSSITYEGDCPGYSGIGGWTGMSFLASVPPAMYQRIRITNNSNGGAYTDREYDERRSFAEAFNIEIAGGHSDRGFRLKEGVNNITYRIYNSRTDKTIAEGAMTTEVSITRKTESRSFSSIVDDAYCAGEASISKDNRTSLDFCEGGVITIAKKGICPGGNEVVLSSRTEVRQNSIQPGNVVIPGIFPFSQQQGGSVRFTCSPYSPGGWATKYRLMNSSGQVISNNLDEYDCERMKKDFSQ